MNERRTTATSFFTTAQVRAELLQLRFAVSSLVQLVKAGSNEREVAENAARGINERINYCHDSLLERTTQ